VLARVKKIIRPKTLKKIRLTSFTRRFPALSPRV
jgi:hypothetical protein